MEYFQEFHWWYLLVVFVLFLIFGKGKGGFVVKRFTANMEILDNRFEGCKPEATYSTFKEGNPDHIDIEIENLSLQVNEELECYLDGKHFASVKVKRDKEAEFDHWSDEGVDFPKIEGGEELVVKYHNINVLKGTFK